MSHQSKRQKTTHIHVPRRPKFMGKELLAAELLLIIFELAIADCASSPEELCLLPYTLSHVCRKWRDIVNAAPILWTNIVFSLHKPIDLEVMSPRRIRSGAFKSNRSGLKLAKHALRRSGDHQRLRVIVEPLQDRDRDRRSVDEMTRLYKFFRLLKPSLHRVKTLQITVNDSFTGAWLAGHVTKLGPLPGLKTLSLRCGDPFNVATCQWWTGERLVDPPPPPGRLMSTPLLTHLTLSVTHFFTVDLLALETLQGLESLTLTEYSLLMQERHNPIPLLKNLQLLPVLKHLELDGLLENDPADEIEGLLQEDAEGLAKLSLESLTFQRMSGSFMEFFLKWIFAPSLTTVALKHANYSRDTVIAVAGLNSERFPQMHTFHISDSCYSIFQESLAHLSWVKTMSILRINKCTCRRRHRSIHDTDIFVPALERVWDVSEQWHCPQLVDLTIEVHGGYHAHELRACIRDRKERAMKRNCYQPPAIIQRLTVTDCECHEPLPDEYRESMARYCPDFQGPRRKFKVQLSHREDETTWHYHAPIGGWQVSDGI
ncbi:hypothetical protein EUX98_g2791 [Antrodiella citrinella]|uniref:Uncharacterized protein n=1 Tax=Antrodiella citrinella TaxID=2447956 RepID=A0A4S4N0C4_9APHY|nr:hypothetical protein EUX98_g2791 [Antrodiella citrinella]